MQKKGKEFRVGEDEFLGDGFRDHAFIRSYTSPELTAREAQRLGVASSYRFKDHKLVPATMRGKECNGECAWDNQFPRDEVGTWFTVTGFEYSHDNQLRALHGYKTAYGNWTQNTSPEFTAKRGMFSKDWGTMGSISAPESVRYDLATKTFTDTYIPRTSL
ncbi:hypothetical protein HZB02_01785 [Candidatus Woesearchaeota archaeon]|nr:hypothetical protein [Candidatus Woesearchaeota archaeon]